MNVHASNLTKFKTQNFVSYLSEDKNLIHTYSTFYDTYKKWAWVMKMSKVNTTLQGLKKPSFSTPPPVSHTYRPKVAIIEH